VPELPEMQALAERLEAAVGGRELVRIDPLQFSALKTVVPAPETFYGSVLDAVGRRGKFVVMHLGGPRIAFHCSQGGRVDVEEPPKTTRPKGRVVRFVFDGLAVFLKEFGTDRKAGWWTLDEGDDGPMAALGPEPTSEDFANLIRTGTDKRRIHTMLRDQRTVAGLGRGYTDDILHVAGLSPYASLSTLKAADRERLLDAVLETIDDGLTHERRRTGGLPTKLGDHWRVHNRYGTPCPVCGNDLRRVSYESHEVTYCPTCQTGGKVLADRRMSRLIR
jgi:formamidopyrimidine-DNA glycosylase